MAWSLKTALQIGQQHALHHKMKCLKCVENQLIIACLVTSIDSIPFTATPLWIKTKGKKNNPSKDKCAKRNVNNQHSSVCFLFLFNFSSLQDS